jgi:hypothetical protein
MVRLGTTVHDRKVAPRKLGMILRVRADQAPNGGEGGRRVSGFCSQLAKKPRMGMKITAMTVGPG